MSNFINIAVRLQHIEAPFTYACRQNGEIVKRSLSSREQCSIFVRTILLSPFVFFVGGIPIFFILCARAKTRHEDFVYLSRSQQIRIFNRDNHRVNARVSHANKAKINGFFKTLRLSPCADRPRWPNASGYNPHFTQAALFRARDEPRVPTSTVNGRREPACRNEPRVPRSMVNGRREPACRNEPRVPTSTVNGRREPACRNELRQGNARPLRENVKPRRSGVSARVV